MKASPAIGSSPDRGVYPRCMADGLVKLTHAQSHVSVAFIVPSVLVRTDKNDTKTLVWMKILCLVFAVLKTDTLENVLVWKDYIFKKHETFSVKSF